MSVTRPSPGIKHVLGKSAGKHATHSKRQSRWLTRVFSKSAGYYSTMQNIWKGTNARRKGLRTGGFERKVRVSR